MLRRRPDNTYEFLVTEALVRSARPHEFAPDRKEAVLQRILAARQPQLGPQRAMLAIPTERWILVPAGVGLAAAIMAGIALADQASGSSNKGNESALVQGTSTGDILVDGKPSQFISPKQHVQALSAAWVTFRGRAEVGLEPGATFSYEHAGDAGLLINAKSGRITLVSGDAPLDVSGPGWTATLLGGTVASLHVGDTGTAIEVEDGSLVLRPDGEAPRDLGKGGAATIGAPIAGPAPISQAPARTEPAAGTVAVPPNSGVVATDVQPEPPATGHGGDSPAAGLAGINPPAGTIPTTAQPPQAGAPPSTTSGPGGDGGSAELPQSQANGPVSSLAAFTDFPNMPAGGLGGVFDPQHGPDAGGQGGDPGSSGDVASPDGAEGDEEDEGDGNTTSNGQGNGNSGNGNGNGQGNGNSGNGNGEGQGNGNSGTGGNGQENGQDDGNSSNGNGNGQGNGNSGNGNSNGQGNGNSNGQGNGNSGNGNSNGQGNGNSGNGNSNGQGNGNSGNGNAHGQGSGNANGQENIDSPAPGSSGDAQGQTKDKPNKKKEA